MIYFLAWLMYPILEASVQGLFFKMWPKWFGYHFDPHREPIYLRILRGAAYFLWAIWLQYMVPVEIMDIRGLYYFIITSSFATCSFWVLFDPLLNLIRYKIGHLPTFQFFYNGTESGMFDDIDEMFSQRDYIIMKVVALLIAVADVLLFHYLFKWHVF